MGLKCLGISGLSRNSGNVTGIALSSAMVSAMLIASGYQVNVEAVLNADNTSHLVMTFINGMKLVFIFMGTLQLVSATAIASTRLTRNL